MANTHDDDVKSSGVKAPSPLGPSADFMNSGPPWDIDWRRQWVSRLEDFRKLKLKQDIEDQFDIKDLARFFHYIIDMIRPPGWEPAPIDIVKQSLDILAHYGASKYGKSKEKIVTRPETLLLHAFFEDYVRQGRLTRSHQHPKAWIGFLIISRIMTAYLNDAEHNGTRSWDVTLNNCLSLNLVVALAREIGEIRLTGEHDTLSACLVRWRDVTMRLRDDRSYIGPPSLDETLMSLECEIAYNSIGDRGVTQGCSKRLCLKVFNGTEYKHMDPCLLLITIAMRTGQAHTPTLPGILSEAAQHPQGIVTWKFPNRPLIPMQCHKGTSVALNTPAGAQQPLYAVKIMASVAGLLGPAYVHASARHAAQPLSKSIHVGKALASDKELFVTRGAYINGITGEEIAYSSARHSASSQQRRGKLVNDHSLANKGSLSILAEELADIRLRDGDDIEPVDVSALRAFIGTFTETSSDDDALKAEGAAVKSVLCPLSHNIPTPDAAKGDSNAKNVPLSEIYPTDPEKLFSRAPPQPYVFTCRGASGCTFRSVDRRRFLKHIRSCKPTPVGEANEGTAFKTP